MPDVGDVIHSVIQADSTVAAITTTVAPGKVPEQKDYPAVTYDQISGVGLDHKDGTSDMDTERWQIASRAKKRIDAVSLDKAVRSAIDGYSGTVNGVEVLSIRFKNRRTDWESGQDVHRIISDYQILAIP